MKNKAENKKETEEEIKELRKENHTKYYDDAYGYDIEINNDREIELKEAELKGQKEMLDEFKKMIDEKRLEMRRKLRNSQFNGSLQREYKFMRRLLEELKQKLEGLK